MPRTYKDFYPQIRLFFSKEQIKFYFTNYRGKQGHDAHRRDNMYADQISYMKFDGYYKSGYLSNKSQGTISNKQSVKSIISKIKKYKQKCQTQCLRQYIKNIEQSDNSQHQQRNKVLLARNYIKQLERRGKFQQFKGHRNKRQLYKRQTVFQE